jgi:hypothetical protein
MKAEVRLGRFSIGVGDRFAQQARAQLQACQLAAERGVEIIPVWNKSNREHLIVQSKPASVRAAAQAAVNELGWRQPWHVDADHIRLETVDRFLPHSDFFTIDVADSIGKPPEAGAIKEFADRHPELVGHVAIPGLANGVQTNRTDVEKIAAEYLAAVAQAAQIYRHIEKSKGRGTFIAEVSMDETEKPQTPVELLVLLAAVADASIPIQTIAPKFTGRFNKGVDYVGDVAQFEQEFNDDICVINHAVREYGLPDNLKLSVHSGSDKFSIYAPIRRALQRHHAGLHLKTAGTTWLEEMIGLAESGGEGLAMARDIYASALDHLNELCAPYLAVIDIDRTKLPSGGAVSSWTSGQFVAALRHDPLCREFNPHLRQLLHVGYKIAVQKGIRFLNLVNQHQSVIARNVTENIFSRHLVPIFLGN